MVPRKNPKNLTNLIILFKNKLPKSFLDKFNFELKTFEKNNKVILKVGVEKEVYISDIGKCLPIITETLAITLVKDAKYTRGNMYVRIYNPGGITNPVVVPVTDKKNDWLNKVIETILESKPKYLNIFIDVFSLY